MQPELGRDENPGTRDAPLKTLRRAAKLIRPSGTIWLFGGAYEASTQPGFEGYLDEACGMDSGVLVPADVALRSVPGERARLRFDGRHALCLSGGSVQSIGLERRNFPGPLIETSAGSLALTGLTFRNAHLDNDAEYETVAAIAAIAASGAR